MSHKIALIGNPNVGKSSIFNLLTGQNQKIGNYAGVTVESKTGSFVKDGTSFEIIDLPGTYSLYPSSDDEKVVLDILSDPAHLNFPDKVVVVANATDLKKSLLLLTQIMDMGFDVLLVLNMMDEVEKRHIEIDIENLSKELGMPVIAVSAKTGIQKEDLIKAIGIKNEPSGSKFYSPPTNSHELIAQIKQDNHIDNDYIAWQHALNSSLTETRWKKLLPENWHPTRLKTYETIKRYEKINPILEKTVYYPDSVDDIHSKLDKVLMHPVWGYVIFSMILLLIFQAIYSWSTYPMEWIDNFVNVDLTDLFLKHSKPGPAQRIIVQGILPGIAGILVFVPQITLLFFFLLLLEESGYMSRVVYLMDKWLKPFGISGKSVVPLISGVACAVPAIMATRTIASKKERLITIMVVPFMTCSARLPVYTIIIALIIPNISYAGVNLQAVVLLGLYMLGLATVLLVAYGLTKFMKSPLRNYLVMEMPAYKLPHPERLVSALWHSVWSFVWGAGRIIFAVSILMWSLSQIGWNDAFRNPEKYVSQKNEGLSEINTIRLENSILGIMGRSIEPAIEPLGYDWKIGVALISSFAAREVFVGTLSTIYSIDDHIDAEIVEKSLIHKMKKQRNPVTGQAVYSFATGVSLLLFYVFSMQCMSTFAVVKRETASWKWPVIQLIGMLVFAYFVAFLSYQILS